MPMKHFIRVFFQLSGIVYVACNWLPHAITQDFVGSTSVAAFQDVYRTWPSSYNGEDEFYVHMRFRSLFFSMKIFSVSWTFIIEMFRVRLKLTPETYSGISLRNCAIVIMQGGHFNTICRTFEHLELKSKPFKQ